MPALPALGVFTVAPDRGTVNRDEYLSDVSPHHKPWDIHRAEADEVGGIYGASSVRRHLRYAERVGACAQVLEFARDPPADDQKQKLKLKTAWFCRVRHCPVCQWRRSLQWQARLYQALPHLLVDYPDTRFLFLTLTIRNCAVDALRYTLGVMARAWRRLIELWVWPAIGWIRAVEITRSKDSSAHPHYHSLLMVPPAYFADGYLKQREWAELWRQCLRLTYTPVVDVRVIKQSRKRSWLKVNRVSIPQMWSIVTEILKYSVKPSDMMRDHAWFLAMSDQVLKTRAVAVGGVLKQYLREHADLTSEPGEDPPAEIAERLFFGWKQEVRRYRRVNHEKHYE
jgi:plasmid rolling circle replication initiator protein Rep